jgi:16S rRNA (cytosine967-C5)-methyltransferase
LKLGNVQAKLKRLAARADLVLVDAPCSGTGTLRRNPELKWRLQSTSVDELGVVQGSILRAAAKLVKPGGALVYATCSLLERENEVVAAAFSEAHPEFGDPVFLHLRPEITQTDGFFAARWVRAPKRVV